MIEKAHFDELNETGFFDINIEELIKENDIYFSVGAIYRKKDINSLSESAKELAELIRSMFFMSVTIDEPKTPYTSFSRRDGKRTFIVSDLGKDDALSLFLHFKDYARSPLITSWFYDALWQAKKLGRFNFDAHKIAVDAYLEAFNYLLELECIEHLDDFYNRFFHLVLNIKRNEDQRKQLLKVTKSILEHPKLNDGEQAITTNIWEKSLRLGFPKETYETILKQGESYLFKATIHSHGSIYLYELLIKIASLLDNDKKVESYQCAIAEAYKNLADQIPSAMIKINHFKSAIEAYRRIIGNPYKDRIVDLQKEVSSLQLLNLKEMKHYSRRSIDVSKEVQESEKAIRGKSFVDALATIFKTCLFFSREYIKEMVKKNDSVTMDLFSVERLNDNGQTVSKSTGGEKELYAINSHYGLNSSCFLLPMLDVLNEEHNFSWRDFLPVLKYHPFVPEGYEEIFAKGVYHFLRKDFMDSALFLIPQLENSFRHFLSDEVLTTYVADDKTDKNIIDMAWLLNKILERKSIPDEIIYSFEILLLRPEFNVRNNICHGFLKAGSFHNSHVVFLLYIIFWLAIYPAITEYLEHQDIEKNKQVETN